MRGEWLAYIFRRLGPSAPGLPPWNYESPTPDRPTPWLPGGRFEMQAWVLPSPAGMTAVRLASGIDGLTRIHEPTVSRLDVVRKLIDPQAGPELALCGYRLILPVPICGWRLGLERDGYIHWLLQLDRAPR